MNLDSENIQEKQSLAILAAEILRDTQKLFEQQVTLTKLQLFEDWTRAKPFALWLAVGLMALAGAGVLSAFTFVYVLNEFTELRLWACFAIVGLAFFLVAAMTLTFARARLKGRTYRRSTLF